MTIAAGFVVPDGIILAADTKESYGENDHTYINKIEVDWHTFPSAQSRPKTQSAYIAIVGSGDGYLIDHITGQIKRIFHETADSDMEVFGKALSELMPCLYASPAFTAYPHSDITDLYTQFLIAVRLNNRQPATLFETNSSLVNEVLHNSLRIIGCGTMKETANELIMPDLSRDSMYDAKVAALYLIYEAKRHYSSVGGLTHIYHLPHPGAGARPEAWNPVDQGLRENLFQQLRDWHHRIVMTVGSVAIAPESYEIVLDQFQRDMRRIRKEFIVMQERERERQHDETLTRAREFWRQLEEAAKKAKQEPSPQDSSQSQKP